MLKTQLSIISPEKVISLIVVVGVKKLQGSDKPFEDLVGWVRCFLP